MEEKGMNDSDNGIQSLLSAQASVGENNALQVYIPQSGDGHNGGALTALSRFETFLNPNYLRNCKVEGPALAERLKGLANPSRARAVNQFYLDQNEIIDELLEDERFSRPSSVQSFGQDIDPKSSWINTQVAINGSLIVNIILFVAQLYAAISSSSVSLYATCADSFMDIASGTMLWYANHVSTNVQHSTIVWPIGKGRIETIGIIVFSSLMGTLSLQLIIEAVKQLAAGDTHNTTLTPINLGLIGAAIFVKVLLLLYCRMLSSKSPAARILAVDHRNDLLLNSLGVVTSVLGYYTRWWIDPAGGILIAILIFSSWAREGYDEVQLILGRSADAQVIRRIAYLTLTHDNRILHLDTCRVYHSGSRFVAEVDIVLPPSMPLQEAHDIGEALQMKIEKLEMVERAFVHLDYEFSHRVMLAFCLLLTLNFILIIM